MNPSVKLARETIEKYLKNNQLPDLKNTDKSLITKKGACFVTVHKTNGDLRGCIGTILPTHKNLAGEIINNAVSACQDPRFEPLKKDELNNIKISVDILSEPESISSIKSLDPKKYGVIVKTKDGRTGLLLPDIEGVDDINYQVAIARQKAGILPHEKIFLYRFTVERHKEI